MSVIAYSNYRYLPISRMSFQKNIKCNVFSIFNATFVFLYCDNYWWFVGLFIWIWRVHLPNCHTTTGFVSLSNCFMTFITSFCCYHCLDKMLCAIPQLLRARAMSEWIRKTGDLLFQTECKWGRLCGQNVFSYSKL